MSGKIGEHHWAALLSAAFACIMGSGLADALMGASRLDIVLAAVVLLYAIGLTAWMLRSRMPLRPSVAAGFGFVGLVWGIMAASRGVQVLRGGGAAWAIVALALAGAGTAGYVLLTATRGAPIGRKQNLA